MKNTKNYPIALVGLGVLSLLVTYSSKDRRPSISPVGAEVIQAFIYQNRSAPSTPMLVRPDSVPILHPPAPFQDLDPAFWSAAKVAEESWKPVETIPVLRLDTVSLRGVTFSSDCDDYFDFNHPIIIRAQALLGYSDVRNSVATRYQAFLLRDSQGWKLKDNRRI